MLKKDMEGYIFLVHIYYKIRFIRFIQKHKYESERSFVVYYN